MKNDIQEQLKSLILEALSALDLGTPAERQVYLDFPADSRFGELSTNVALQLSKSLKKSPRAIGESIVSYLKENLSKNPLKEYLKEIKVEGAGFVNFYFQERFFHGYLKGVVAGGKDALSKDIGKGKKVLVEFVSANPTGPLSVAHARQAAVGDSLAKIMGFLGFKVEKEYYLNDEGNQINILGRSVELRLKELNGEKIEFPEDHYQGDYIYDIAKSLPTPNSQLQTPNSQLSTYSDFATQYILDIIKKELQDFGVEFDTWFSQKKLREDGKIDKALDFLKAKGFLYEQDGALWFKSTQFGDDKDRVVIKSDRSYTYLAPDIAYHQDKYKRGFEWLINLWGPDHHGYINRLKASAQALGEKADSLSIIIVQLATIFREGKPVQMSTRRGQYITLREVLDEVGLDAARFFFLMRRTSSHLDFDLDVAKKQTAENPVYYVQYAHARISSILRSSGIKIDKDTDLSLLKEKEEIDLARKLWQFAYSLSICINTLDPYLLTVYLQELAETFHKFYDRHRVLTEDAALTKARLVLVDAARIVIKAGLELLGVSQPEKM